jgi:enamine deaminase RidA (YjgF/YER057c/UK114 family)
MEHTFSEAMSNLSGLVGSKQDFVIMGLSGKLNEAAENVEKAIEASGMSCRVYTRNRGYATAVAAFVPWVGWAAIGSLVAHRLATRNPDFEVGKDIGANKLYVNYKK